MSEIIYPTLDLFLYDLRNGLGENEDEIHENRDHFKKKNPEGLWPRLFERDTGFEAEYVELLGEGKYKNKHFKAERQSYPLEGYHYPVRLGDSYGLLLDCSVNNLKEPQPAKSFAALKKEIESRLDNNPKDPQQDKSYAANKKKIDSKLDSKIATIGQTWMISGIVPASDTVVSDTEACPRLEEIAKTCYKELMPDSQWDKELEEKGKFLGATIFELSRYKLKLTEDGDTAPTDIQSIQDDRHVIIILYPNPDIAKKAAKFYQYWMRLFYYRHKILWSYGQSRLLKQNLKKYFVTIHNCIEHIGKSDKTNLNFKELRQKLTEVQKTFTPYSIELTYLDFQIRTIDMNFSNYQKCSSSLKEEAGYNKNIAAKKLSNKEFSNLVRDKYFLQITRDYDNLSLGFKLLDTSLNTLRSRVEVDKAVREGAFRNTISVLGLAISANSAVVIHAKSFAFYKKEERALEHPIGSFLYNRLNVPKESLGGSIVLVLGLGAALIAASIAQIVIGWRRGQNNSQ